MTNQMIQTKGEQKEPKSSKKTEIVVNRFFVGTKTCEEIFIKLMVADLEKMLNDS